MSSSAAAAAAATSPRIACSPSKPYAIITYKRRPNYPRQHSHKSYPESVCDPCRRFAFSIPKASASAATVPLLAFLRKQKAVLDPTATFQDIRVIGGGKALANHVRRAKLKLWWQRGGARPLDVFGGVVGALIFAAQDVHFVQAPRGAANTFELRNGGDAVMARLEIFAKGKCLDV